MANPTAGQRWPAFGGLFFSLVSGTRERIPANHHSINLRLLASEVSLRTETSEEQGQRPAAFSATKTNVSIRSDQEAMSAYAASNEVLVYLIKQTLDGSPERLAAKFILDCLRNFRTPEEIEARIHQSEEEALLDVGDEARQLAEDIGLRV